MPDKRESIYDKETIRILRKMPDEAKNGTELAIIRWIKDGRAFEPQLTNHEVYVDRLTRQRKYGKNKGLKWSDWKFLTENPERIKEITELLQDLPMRPKPKTDERLPYSDGPATEDQDPFTA